jgi:predicted RNase H-like nuclease
MIFLGIDAAWGEINETGVVALDQTGVILDAGWAIGLDNTMTWIKKHTQPDTLIFIDAPLIVTNETGQRPCEKQVGQRYGRWKVSANSTNKNSPRLGGVALRKTLEKNGFRYDDGIDGPPRSGKTVSECYPYTAIVGYEPFGYDERPRYKRKPKAMKVAEFRPLRALACDGLINRMTQLAHAESPIDLRSHSVTRKLLEEQSPIGDAAYKHREDLLDAALSAWTAALWYQTGFETCQVLGADGPQLVRPAATIIAPARPIQRAPGAARGFDNPLPLRDLNQSLLLEQGGRDTPLSSPVRPARDTAKAGTSGCGGEVMANETGGNLPPIPVVPPNGTCFCGCGGATNPGKHFVQFHDRKAESRVIKERFGGIAAFVVWAERHMPKIDEQ